MKNASVLLSLALLGFSLVVEARDPERAVGAVTLELENKAASRKIAAELWFEASPGTSVEELSFRPPLRPVLVARNAEPDPASGKRPLIVISHGNWGSRYSQGWLAMKLVNAGYVVLSTSHPGTLGEDQTAAGRFRLWDRSRDVSFTLDEVLKNPRWAALIESERIGFIGHSFGGWTGVSLAGGRYDPMRQRAYCEKSAQKDFYCDGALKDDLSNVSAGGAGDAFRDPRIRAFYIMASGPAQGFTGESLKAIGTPFVVDTAELDEILEPMSNSSTLARQIPNSKEIKRPVGHFAYVPECRPLVGKALAKLAGVPICDDPEGVDRQSVHQRITSDVIAFFGRIFK